MGTTYNNFAMQWPFEWFFSLPVLSQIGSVYLIVINGATFFYFGVDKIKSRLADRRVSERMLWGLAFAGGSLGALLGMHFFRHKTKKISFQAGIALILAVHIVIVFYLSTARPS